MHHNYISADVYTVSVVENQHQLPRKQVNKIKYSTCSFEGSSTFVFAVEHFAGVRDLHILHALRVQDVTSLITIFFAFEYGVDVDAVLIVRLLHSRHSSCFFLGYVYTVSIADGSPFTAFTARIDFKVMHAFFCLFKAMQ
ncbi:hypothetical protein PRIPAC_90612 [Pristionchus pacificus]|uniref:Uncharacterized protein n=1 Tax=Pristionchus pacificus TaxID=54126 RepID=A0A2A6B8V1_PRIPA|nr:hypothetical protein PRIPAC_90612 [Pristionchus pacificus]|eukprot:PDM62309.1 hypothetical protein PRIPAC_51751 [Pristionchus pacificus]